MQNSVVFFGSGPVAARALELLSSNFIVESIITKPKPPHHRGTFPVLDLADQLNIPAYTASNKTELSELVLNRSFKSKLGVLIDFGIIVNQDVIDYFPLGIVNSHFSVLPEWRGADPITFAILSGQKSTGVSLMLLTAGMDEGPLIGYGEQKLDGRETTPLLTEKLINLSNALLNEELPKRFDNPSQGAPQSITGRKVSYSRKLTKDNGIIDWAKPAEEIEREIRAYIDWPKSFTTLAGKEVIITAGHVSDATGQPGSIDITSKQIVVHCGKNSLVIDRLKPMGKQEMTAAAFLAGYGQLFK